MREQFGRNRSFGDRELSSTSSEKERAAEEGISGPTEAERATSPPSPTSKDEMQPNPANDDVGPAAPSSAGRSQRPPSPGRGGGNVHKPHGAAAGLKSTTRDSITDGILNSSLQIKNRGHKNKSGGSGRPGVGVGVPRVGAGDRGGGVGGTTTRSDAMTRVSGLLWDIGSQSDHSTLDAEARSRTGSFSMFDPDGLAAAVEEDDMKEREARWEEFGRTCGRICKATVLLAVLVGVAVATTAVIKSSKGDSVESDGTALKGGGTKPPDTGNFPSDDNIEEVCSELNLQDDNGYDECHNLCERAYCCFLPHWDKMSCVETNANPCTAFIEHCSTLGFSEEEGESPESVDETEGSNSEDNQDKNDEEEGGDEQEDEAVAVKDDGSPNTEDTEDDATDEKVDEEDNNSQAPADDEGQVSQPASFDTSMR